MDESRRADLKRIDERLATNKMQVKSHTVVTGYNPVTRRPIKNIVHEEYYNPKLDKWGKDQALKAKANILRQSKDKKLRKLREELIRAARAGDKKAELHITAKIRKHEGKPFEDYS